MKLNTKQLERASEVFGNVSVAWFTAGVIASLFARLEGGAISLRSLAAGSVMAILFFNWSLLIISGDKS